MEVGVLDEELLPPVMEDQPSYEAVSSYTRAEAERHELWGAIRCFVGPHGAITVSINLRTMVDVDLDMLDQPLDQQTVSDMVYNEMVFETVEVMAILKHKLDAAVVREPSSE